MSLLARMLTAMLLVIVFLGRLQAEPQTSASVVGLWFGEGYQPAVETSMTWLMHRNEDGTFIVEFRRYQSCKLVFRQVEEGRWRQDGPKYFTTTVSIDGNSFHAEDEYLIEEITSTEMKYRHLNSNTSYQARRISPQVGFPVPAHCTI